MMALRILLLERRIETVERKFLRPVVGRPKMNRVTREGTNMYSLNKINVGYRCKWAEGLLRMNDNYVSKSAYEYSPTGRRNASRPRERWREQHPRKRDKAGMICFLTLRIMMATSILVHLHS
jgi:hypothetical protein